MNKQFIQKAILTLIIITLLVTTVVFCYCYQHYDLLKNRLVQRTLVVIPEKQFVPEISTMMALQGIQCEKVPHKEYVQMQLKLYYEFVNNYKSFHREGVKKLHSGKSSDVRTLTWHCSNSYLCGGLGYRFLGMTTSLLFAMFSNRVLLLRWDKTSVENTYLLPNMIDWRYLNYSLNGSFKDLGSFHEITGTRKQYENKMIRSLAGNTKHIQYLYNLLSHPEEIISKFNPQVKTLGFSRSHNFHLFYSVSFMYLFKISEELQSYANVIRSKLNLHGKRYVALHLRTGDFNDSLAEHPRSERFVGLRVSLEEAMNCAIKQANKHISSDAVIVVVSDSVSTKQNLAKMYSRVKILDNVPVHVDKTAVLDKDGMLGTWQDLIILAEAHIIVYRRSSFPMLAMAMCEVLGNRAIDYYHCPISHV